MTKQLREIYQLKIELKGIRPPIWRRFLVANTMTLAELHVVLQIVMGWTDSHLHEFTVGKARYGIIDPEYDMDWGSEKLQDERLFKIKDALKAEGDFMSYEYDFGDGWEHKISLEKVLPFELNQQLPYCIKGKRACPPEDVGGPWGYEEFLEAWLDVNHPEHEDLKEWAGDYFSPELFDVAETNDILAEVFGDV